MFVVPEERRLVQPGQKFGRLTVAGSPFYAVADGRRTQHAVFRCECGVHRLSEVNTVKRGRTTACRKCTVIRIGKARTFRTAEDYRILSIWHAMRRRCYSEGSPSHADYGGRGIVVCDEWHDFEAFLSWAKANGHRSDLSIDRIDNNGNYEPSNCRWATQEVQSNNVRRNVRITAFGESKTLSEWPRDPRAVVSRDVLRYRIDTGWDAEAAITTPSRVYAYRA